MDCERAPYLRSSGRRRGVDFALSGRGGPSHLKGPSLSNVAAEASQFHCDSMGFDLIAAVITASPLPVTVIHRQLLCSRSAATEPTSVSHANGEVRTPLFSAASAHLSTLFLSCSLSTVSLSACPRLSSVSTMDAAAVGAKDQMINLKDVIETEKAEVLNADPKTFVKVPPLTPPSSPSLPYQPCLSPHLHCCRCVLLSVHPDWYRCVAQ